MAFAALGLGAASASSYVHYHLLTDPSYSSFCDVNATVNCTQAYLSSVRQPVRRAGRTVWRILLHARAAAGRCRRARRARRCATLFPPTSSRSRRRPRVHSVSRVGVVRAAEDVLHAVRGDLRLGHCHLHRFRWSDDFSHDYAAAPHSARCPRARVQSHRARAGAAVRWRRRARRSARSPPSKATPAAAAADAADRSAARRVAQVVGHAADDRAADARWTARR